MMLSGLGRVQRGAEAAFLEIARQLAQDPDTHVEVFGAGAVAIPGVISHAIACRPRERFQHWPRFPCFRGEGTYEESSFVWNLARSGRYRPNNFDVVVTCTYPWVNWYVQRAGRKRRRPVTSMSLRTVIGPVRPGIASSASSAAMAWSAPTPSFSSVIVTVTAGVDPSRGGSRGFHPT